MANSDQARKRIRQNTKAYAHNKQAMTRIRTHKKRAQLAILNQDIPLAMENLKTMTQLIHRAVRKNLLHKNTAARWVRRLNTAIKKAA